MKNKFILILALFPAELLFSGGLLAQYAGPQLIAASGHVGMGTSFSLSYSVGELAVSTLNAGAYSLTQGFQQPGLEITGELSLSEADGTIKTWPNPVTDILYLKFDTRVKADIVMEAYDLLGRLHRIVKYEAPIQKDPYSLDMTGMKSGLYILKIQSRDEKISDVIRVMKD